MVNEVGNDVLIISLIKRPIDTLKARSTNQAIQIVRRIPTALVAQIKRDLSHRNLIIWMKVNYTFYPIKKLNDVMFV